MHRLTTLAVLGLTLLAACSQQPTRSAAAPQTAGATAGAGESRVTGQAVSGPWDAYNLSPRSRTLAPVAVYRTNGTVQNPDNTLKGQGALIQGQGSSITFDFGKEVAGIVTLNFSAASSAYESVGLAFTESPNYVGTASDGSNAGINNGRSGPTDGAIYTTVTSTGASSYTMPGKSLRGGFRYLTVFMNSGGWIHLSGVSLNFTAAPLMSDPGAYPNYFYSNDDLINKLWYAGAYTVQTNTVSPNQGRQLLADGWDNSAVISGGSSVLTDGAKRDRQVWPGDLGISTPSAYVSTGDTVSTKNALQRMYDMQKSSGELPYAGPPFNFYGSDTYHLWTMLGTSSYYLYTGDDAWLGSIWSKYKAAMTFITGKMNGPNGLLSVTGTADWARHGQGGENIAANAMLYRALTSGAQLADTRGEGGTASGYRDTAARLKANINRALWDSSRGAYRDNPGSNVYPQDGNSLAVWYGVPDTADKAAAVANDLNSNVTTYGARTPEWGDISPFAGSMQLMALLTASSDTSALDLMRREWGHMYNHPGGTKTFWEGISINGGPGGYTPWFMSYAHGWSTGPTSALTFFTLGIQPTSARGQNYSVIPHPGDLTHVEGQLTVDGGKVVKNSYDRASDGSFSMTVDSSSNAGSTGVIGVPKFGASRTIAINGSTAWNGSSFVGAYGVASADQDSHYVYFRGVQPGARTFSFTAAAATWNTCANEGGRCTFGGAKGVRYGSGSTFVYGSFTGGVACTNATFGDPTPNVLKHCELSDTVLPPSGGSWTLCAAENQTCTFSNTKTVAFGANGKYAQRLATGSVPCNTATFGDPVYGVVKSCFVSNLPQNASFENPAVSNYVYNPSGAGWTFSAQNGDSGSGIQANGGAFGAGAAPQGVQTAFVQRGASLTQTLSDLAADTYAVTFRAARRTTYGGQQTVNVYLDGRLLGSYAPASGLFDAFTTGTVTLGVGNHTLSFVGQNLNEDATAFIDSVALLTY